MPQKTEADSVKGLWRDWKLWAAISVAALFVWWPLALAVCIPSHTPTAAGSYYAHSQPNWQPQPGGFRSIKVVDVITILILFVQALIFAVQAYLMHRQRNINQDLVDIAVTQAKIVERQEAREQKRFEEEFRPRIVVRNLDTTREEDGVLLRFGVFNVGQGDARIGLISLNMSIIQKEPPEGEGDIGSCEGFTVERGRSREVRCVFRHIKGAYNRRNETSHTFVNGIIHYFPLESSRLYLTSFYRVAKGWNPVFRPATDINPDQEYTD